MIDLSNVTYIVLGGIPVEQVSDSHGNTMWTAEPPVTTYNVSISAGSNGTVSVNGVTGNYSQSVPSGTVLTIQGTGDAGYDFDEWSDGVSTNPRTVTVTTDLTLTATFESVVLANYFYVEDTSGSDSTLSIFKYNANAPTVEVFKSTDTTNWVSMGTTSTTAITATVPANSKLYLKATTNTFGGGSLSCNRISCSGNHNVGGNIMSLLYGDNFTGQTTFPTNNSNVFSCLFYGDNKLVDASMLELPATTLVSYSYDLMFQDCTSLTHAPVLPATSFAGQSCYEKMFLNCTSLTTAPALPVTTLTNYCYAQMFQGCTSLTTAPTLPATTLSKMCYYSMFQNCTSLTTAPALPATTLFERCYAIMFSGCTSLVTAPATLPATTLVEQCYYYMFNGCTSLTTAPVLMFTNLGSWSCSSMFKDCESLNKVITYTSIADTLVLNNWLDNVSATGDFYNLGGATYESGSSGIPSGWTEHRTLYYNVSISAGSNGTVSVNGVSGNYSQSVPNGTVLTIKGTANSGYIFDGWSDGVSTNPRTVTVTTDLTLTASFRAGLYYNVSISAGNNGSVSVNGVSGNYSQTVLEGTVLTIQGTGDAGYIFDGWSDGVSTNPRTITVTSSLTLTASFDVAPTPTSSYFYVEDASGSVITNRIRIHKSDVNAPTISIYSSTDGVNWEYMDDTSDEYYVNITIPANGRVYLKANTNKWAVNSTSYNYITATRNFNIGGSIMSLLNGDNYETDSEFTSSNFSAFRKLFYGSTKLIDASALVTPTTANTGFCYSEMFSGCSNLNALACNIEVYSISSVRKWLDGVAASGDFYNLGGADTTGMGIPSGWTVHNSL